MDIILNLKFEEIEKRLIDKSGNIPVNAINSQSKDRKINNKNEDIKESVRS